MSQQNLLYFHHTEFDRKGSGDLDRQKVIKVTGGFQLFLNPLKTFQINDKYLYFVLYDETFYGNLIKSDLAFI
jgi:hypothetical protein